MKNIKTEELEIKSKNLRRNVLKLGLETKEAHFGGSFSEIEILVSLYDVILKKEDKFILSKGHGCYPLYFLLREKGYNPRIAPHPDLDEKNGIYATTGSLGHGFPIGIGMGIAKKKLGKNGKIYVLMGDGECQEGTTWESALIASQHKIDNFHLIIDRNTLQALDETEKILSLDDLEKKFDAFGWDAQTVGGHNFKKLIPVLYRSGKGKPVVTIAETIKGKGISYMEGDSKWHTRLPNEQEIKQAYEELK